MGGGGERGGREKGEEGRETDTNRQRDRQADKHRAIQIDRARWGQRDKEIETERRVGTDRYG